MATLHTPGVYLRQSPARRVPNATRTDVAGFVGLAERGPLDEPRRLTTFREFHGVFGGFLSYANLAYAVRAFFENGGAVCWVVRVAGDGQQTARAVVKVPTTDRLYTVEARGPGVWGNELAVRFLPVAALAMLDPTEPLVETLTLVVEEDGQPVEWLQGRSTKFTIDGETTKRTAGEELIETVNRDSRLLHFCDETPVGPAGSDRVALAGGADGLSALSVADFTGDGFGKSRGLATFELIDEIAIVAIPDLTAPPFVEAPPKPTVPDRAEDPCALDGATGGNTTTVEVDDPAASPIERRRVFGEDEVARGQLALIAHCTSLRDRFAILDPPRAPDALTSVSQDRCTKRTTPDPIRANGQFDTAALLLWRNRFDTRFAALYYPWLRLADPLRPDAPEGRLVPPSGHVAGVYAATDRAEGVFRPPANRELAWVADVAAAIDDAGHGVLNPAGINAIRTFPGRGIRVFGARTLTNPASDRAWLYVNVRRLISALEEEIEDALQWAVFEPNDHQLRFGIRATLTTLLDRLWRRGAFAGESPDAAYAVRCDATTTTADDEAAGRVFAEVHVAPVVPYEFIVLRVGVAADELRVTET